MSALTYNDCLISVVMLTVNRPQYIESAITSVLRQTYGRWELVVVQDGGDPRIAPIVNCFVRSDERVRFFQRMEVGNIANALNFAIRQSSGEFVAILDDDDAWINSRKLELQWKYLREHRDVTAVGGGAVVVNRQGQETMRYQRPLDSAECARRALIANPIIHSTVLYRRSVADAAGLYDETLRGYQDWDLWLKIMQMGKVSNVPDYLATYRVWDGGGSSTKILGNAWSSLRVVVRHMRRYPHGLVAGLTSVAYVGFALLPSSLRRRSYQSLTRFKKRCFSVKS